MGQKELVYSCQQGHRKAQQELYNLYASKLFASCVKYAPNYQEAQDILQDSFITIFKKIHQFENKGSFEGWMKRITINTALQRYRGAKVYQLDPEEQLEDEAVEVDDTTDISLDRLLEMIQDLPDRYRLVFSLYELDGYSHQDIAEMLEISTGTSKSNLARARQSLQKMIRQWRISDQSDAI
ncbi:RNA polymerase sigma factor [Nonlabens xiamenensis]|uniref:RNA polymerase sigma factor n=1 Tax=Nonlabens xiamenensis TaxID=2341043 RepID=UPI000F610039|nr:RNA polymerase sigma factor [Nonlabens xiamenensis]